PGHTLFPYTPLFRSFGLAGSIGERLVAYLGNLATLDLGVSPRYNAPVAELILDRLPNTLFLVVSGLAAAIVVGVLVGGAKATWADCKRTRLNSSHLK